MRLVRHPARLARRLSLAMLLAGCGTEPAGLPAPDDVALTAIPRFYALSDSLLRAGADPRVALAYARLAGSIAVHARISTVRIRVDGAESDWLSIGRTAGVYVAPCPANALCAPTLGPSRLLSVIAWDPANPRRLVQLTNFDQPRPLGGTIPSFGGTLPAPQPSLMYINGDGALFIASVGTQSIDLAPPVRACATIPTGIAEQLIATATARCSTVSMLTRFEATVEPPLDLAPAGVVATGSHALSMTAQPVDGAYRELERCDACAYQGLPPFLLPPLNLRGVQPLSTFLEIRVDSVVTFTLNIRNLSNAPTTVGFPNGQQYDFLVLPSTGGPPVWRWAADKAFGALPTTRALAAGETWRISERWRPAVRGSFLVQGLLTSTTHLAESLVFLTVP